MLLLVSSGVEPFAVGLGELVVDASTGHLTYTPAPDWSGSDGFTFVVDDGELTSAPATVAITVSPVNDAPVADPASFSMPQNGTLMVDVSR